MDKTRQKDLPLPEKDLPLPQKDLPLPEKELPAPLKRGLKLNPKWLVLGLILLVLILIGGIGSYFLLHTDKKIACTTEAKLCPDDKTYVGRTGPNCEFASCPNIIPTPTISLLDVSNWKTYANIKYGFSIKYPLDWTNDVGYWVGFVPSIKTQYLKDLSYPIQIAFVDNPDNIDLPIWQDQMNATDSGIPYHYFDTKNTKTTKINGYTAYLNDKGATCDPFYCYLVIIKANKFFFIFKNVYMSGITRVENGTKKEIYTEKDLQFNRQVFDSMLSTLRFTDLTPTPTCRPRPACLDATPKCLIPETSDMCPPTITPKP